MSDKRKRVELGSESSLADKDGDGYIEPFNVNPDEKNLGGTSDASVDLTDTEVYQETHYYPFGMTMEGEWQDIVNGPENKYLYNGKELNSDFDLNWSDYGARYYDAAIGRWGQVDPLAEKYYSYSPYNYTLNNPIRFIDPDGRSVDDFIDIDKSTGKISVTKAAGDDIVRLVDNGKVVDSYTYGKNGSFNSDNSIWKGKVYNGKIDGTVIITETTKKAEAFYKFAAKADVEFSKIDAEKNGIQISAIGTSHENAVESTSIGTARMLSKEGWTGVKQSHSHPSNKYNESVPSGYYDYAKNNPHSLMPYLKNGKKEGDALNAIQIKRLKGFGNAKFEVYGPANKTITKYDGVNNAKIIK
jgi:RHS repeat-associated protein